jgi:hypothetical protein
MQGMKNRPKQRGGRPVSGVEELPEAGCPLDPETGLGDIVSLGLFPLNASSFLNKIPIS